MGAFASWLNGTLPADASRRDLDLSRTLAVSDFEPTPAFLSRCLGGMPRWLALPVPPTSPLPAVNYCRYEPATNPMRWDESAERAFRQGVDTVAFFLPPTDVWGRTLLRLHQEGVRRVLLFQRGRVRQYRPRVLAACRKVQALWTRAKDWLGAGPTPLAPGDCRALLATVPQRQPLPPPGAPLRIAHFICSLNSGGAERQVCYAAVGQRQAGHEVRVLTRVPLLGDHGHYRFLLEPHGIPVRQAGSVWSDCLPEAWHRLGLSRKFARRLPRDLAVPVADLIGELLRHPVDVLHCYVDDCNIPGAIAACLTGTPCVVLSFRNGNPSHFPGLLRNWMKPWYQALVGRKGVVLSSNSEMGARDYEHWLGLSAGNVPVVRNAFHPSPTPEPGRALEWRRRLRIAPDAPVVAGVFRLHPEKRPLYFLECVRRLKDEIPALRVVLAGVGVLESEVRRKMEEDGLKQTILLLGQQQDVPLLMAGSDVLLLVSDWEGTPNVLLEAQHYGCVPVATDAGGSREAMRDGETGILVGLENRGGAVAAVAGLLRDPARRRRMAEAGRDFVARTYAPPLLDAGNERLYRTDERR